MKYQRRLRRCLRSGGMASAAVIVVSLSAAATGGALAGVFMPATGEQAPPEVVPPLHLEVPDHPYIAVKKQLPATGGVEWAQANRRMRDAPVQMAARTGSGARVRRR